MDKVIITIVTLIAVGCIFTVWYFPMQEMREMTYVSYTGKVLIEDDDEYLEFKKLMADPEVNIVSLETLSSPDHLIMYSFTTEDYIDFDYTDGKAYYRGDLLLNVITGIMITLFIIGVWAAVILNRFAFIWVASRFLCIFP